MSTPWPAFSHKASAISSCSGSVAVDEDRARRRHLLVELEQHVGEHLVLVDLGGVAGPEGAVAPVLPAADEERLHSHLPALAGKREDVGVAHALCVDRLAALDRGGGAQPVAQHRGAFEVEIGGGGGHLHLDLLLHRARLAAEELLRLGDQLGIAFLVDAPHARRAAALDLVEQARPVAPGEEAVGAAPQQEQLLQRVDRHVDRPGAGERAVVVALRAPRAAVLGDAREGVLAAQEDEGEALVVAQQHVVGRAEALDQLRFEQQRLGLRVGDHDLHPPGLADHPPQPVGEVGDLGVVGHAVLQRARLADIEHVAARIEHPVDPGARLQRAHGLADRRHPRLDIGLRARALDGVGRAILVEALGTLGVRRGSGFGARHTVQLGIGACPCNTACNTMRSSLAAGRRA